MSQPDIIITVSAELPAEANLNATKAGNQDRTTPPSPPSDLPSLQYLHANNEGLLLPEAHERRVSLSILFPSSYNAGPVMPTSLPSIYKNINQALKSDRAYFL